MKIINSFHHHSNALNMVSKIVKPVFGTALMAILALTSCSPNDDVYYVPAPEADRPTAQDFANIRNQALENITQNFQFNADDGYITLTSAHGISISIDGSCLTKDEIGRASWRERVQCKLRRIRCKNRSDRQP